MDRRPIFSIVLLAIISVCGLCLWEIHVPNDGREPMEAMADAGNGLDETNTAPKLIAFTFDDGPKAGKTDVLLDELKKRNVQATFFLLGLQIEQYPDIVKRMFEEGHQIGNHTFNHVQLSILDKAGVKSEMEQWEDSYFKIVGEQPYCLRPPFGAVSDAMSEEVNVPMILWSVDTEDWTGKKAQDIADYIIKEAQPGDIILMHDIYDESVKGAILAIDELSQRGYTFVTVDELFQSKNMDLVPGKVYRRVSY